jgi:hypothetical protein
MSEFLELLAVITVYQLVFCVSQAGRAPGLSEAGYSQRADCSAHLLTASEVVMSEERAVALVTLHWLPDRLRSVSQGIDQ